MASLARPAFQPGRTDEDHLAAFLGVGFALSPIASVLLDDALIITAANPAAELTFGSGPRSLLGRTRPLQIVGPMNVNLSPPATAAGYRILREALINSHKHAHAQHIAVRIAPLDSMVVFSVTDDWVGTADTTSPGHLGLATMRARAEAEGGQLHIHSAPGAGMTTVLTLPITAPSS